MDPKATLRDLVGRLCDTAPDAIGPGFSLRTGFLQGSTGRARLDAAIRRTLAITCPAVYTVQNFAELEAAVLGGTAETAVAPTGASVAVSPPPPTPLPPGQDQTACGIDIEMLENLPKVDDYWEADFYRQFFTPAEIAYCLAQGEPRMHFAARWCAKEALKKCDAAFLRAEMNTLQVAVDPQGRPHLECKHAAEFVPLPYAVSLTHTPVLAAAMVLRIPVSSPLAPPPVAPTASVGNGHGSTPRGFWQRLLGR